VYRLRCALAACHTPDTIERTLARINVTAATPRLHYRDRVGVITGRQVSARTLQRVLSRVQSTHGQRHLPSDAELLRVMREQHLANRELFGPRDRIRPVVWAVRPRAS